MELEFTQDFFSQHIPNWERWLAKFKGRRIKALEIGSFEGRSACWLLQHILTNEYARLWCLDTWRGGGDLPEFDDALYARFRKNIAAIPGAFGKVTICQGRSDKTLIHFLQHGGHTFDVIYIDGSHVAADVLTDAVLAWPQLAPGGILIFDDYQWQVDPNKKNQPGPAVDAFLNCFTGYVVRQTGWQLAVEKTA